ncbi:unnamed protein product [Gongylonema pulchrum]|uniref:Conserved secreted protein n=1 Tax=Gongylonema pulchrum TaxID=637853 RepID=A0A183EHT6_9BILA|nr:unnamed protein product [Gongylonema pulchrum]
MFHFTVATAAAAAVLCAISLVQHVQCSAEWFHREPSSEWDAGQYWGKDGSAWGSAGVAKGRAANAYEHGARGHDYSDKDHAGFVYGSKGAADGFSEFAKHAADEHFADALEAGQHALSGAEGHKKYSYFTRGSGPQGFYSKGYFGTNG